MQKVIFIFSILIFSLCSADACEKMPDSKTAPKPKSLKELIANSDSVILVARQGDLKQAEPETGKINVTVYEIFKGSVAHEIMVDAPISVACKQSGARLTYNKQPAILFLEKGRPGEVYNVIAQIDVSDGKLVESNPPQFNEKLDKKPVKEFGEEYFKR